MSIIEDNKKLLNSFKNNPPHPSYIAGFIDGDGCIFIRKILDGYQSGFSITQCRTNILQIIRYHFGGRITTSSNRNNKIINLMDTEKDDCYHKHNIRNQYNLIIQSNEYQILLEYLQNSFIIKENQYQNLNEFNKLVNLIDKKEEKEELYLKCSSLNKICNLNEIYLTRLNIEYISGLFDAEGCIYIDNKKYTKFYISITQKNHTQILYDIVKFLGFGTIDCEIKFKIYNKTNCLKFIHLVKNYLIVKYNQVVAFEKFLETDDIKIKEQMYLICNKEKSEKMKGEGNHNYGKPFSEETKKKMSVSIRESKGGVSDEIIIQVRKMINDGYKNVDIQNLMSLPRHTITRIKNFQIICRTEEKKEKQALTQEQVNLSKRKIDADDIIIVIEKFIENWKPTQILNYFIKENKTNITIDIIKNIKRNLTNNKKIIYESELSQTRYEYYTTLIKQFTETLV